MIRVLWADDQQDVVRSFSSLLGELDTRIVHAPNGEAALAELQAQYFDLLIVDLLMPPDKWGGLWLLRKMKEEGIEVPALVLSGEGSQFETIQALRLGARDYVTKERIQLDLRDRIVAAVGQFDAESLDRALGSLPTPIALSLKRSLSADNPASRLKRIVEFFEMVVRLTALIGLAEFDQPEKRESLHLAVAQVRNPSMGFWSQLGHALAGRLGRSTAFSQLNDSLDRTLISSVIELRNEIAHGSEPSERLALELATKYEAAQKSLLKRLLHGLKFHVVVPTALDFDGEIFRVEGHALRGDSLALPRVTVSSKQPVPTRRAYVLMGQPPICDWTSLWPFLLAEPSLEPAAWQVLIFDGLRSEGDTLTGKEPLRYLDLWTGQRKIGDLRSCQLPGFLFR